MSLVWFHYGKLEGKRLDGTRYCIVHKDVCERLDALRTLWLYRVLRKGGVTRDSAREVIDSVRNTVERW